MAETAKKVNYTEEDVTKLTSMYQELGNEGMDQIAETLGKSVRSVRAKLVREGIYIAPEKKASAKKDKDVEKKGDETKKPEPLDPELQAVTNLCQALLSSNEFLYSD